jgi:hypothetical protein
MNKKLSAYIAGKETVDRDELIRLFWPDYDVPPYKVLAERYIAGKIAQDLSALRDDKKRRLVLAARCEDGIKYIYITACKSPRILRNIRFRILHDIHGQEVSLEKVETQLEEIGEDTEGA